VVFVGEGKGAEALEPFWPRLKRQKVRIEAVATDLSPAYLSAVLTHLPNAVHVFDHFHIIKLYNEGLSDLRRKLYHEATHVMDQKVLKGTRWLLLKNPENLDPKRREAERAGSRAATQSTSGPGLLPERGLAADLASHRQGRRRRHPPGLGGPGYGFRHSHAH
jgi:transposase